MHIYTFEYILYTIIAFKKWKEEFDVHLIWRQ